jgi:hypothetical protein
VTTASAVQFSSPDINASASFASQTSYSSSPRPASVPAPVAAPVAQPAPVNRLPPAAPFVAAPVMAAPVINGPTGYSAQPIPAVRSPPATSSDPRVKDSIEICQFAISALKVTFCILVPLRNFSYGIHLFSIMKLH